MMNDLQTLWSQPAADPVADRLGELNAAIARQPIVDEKRAVVGYELFERPRIASNDDALLFDALSDMAAADTLAGRKTIFLRCTFENIADGHLELLDPAKVVLEIPAQPVLFEHDVATRLAALQRARNSGFRLAFDQSVLRPEYAAWLPLASYIKLDLQELPSAVVEQVVRVARTRSKAQLVADQVGLPEQYELMKRLGVKLFQGNWFEQPVVIQDRSARTSQANVIRLLNLVRQEADIAEIEELLKKDPAIAYKLLRFINSCSIGLKVEITSFRHAVMILGLNQLFRWATLLLTSARPGGAAPAAGTAAVVRGRFMELLAADLTARENCDNAFVTGVFSLLDTLIGLPLAKALEAIDLPEVVVGALLRNEGELAALLALAKTCESADEAAFAQAANQLQLSNQRVNQAHLQALVWADQLQD